MKKQDMIILGISNGETASACLVSGDKVVAAASEERFSRIKMHNAWPNQSIEYVLSSRNLTLEDIDAIAYGWSKGFEAEKHLLPYFDRIVYEVQNNIDNLDVLRERIEAEILRDAVKRDEFNGFIETNSLRHKAVYFNHHECHALSSFVCSPFPSSLVITADGRGDFDSLTIHHFQGGQYRTLYRASSNDSLGMFYGRITALLGHQPHRHEGKVTGLAAYGDASKYLSAMQEMIYVKDGRVYARNGDMFRPFYSNFSDRLKAIIAAAKPEDIAAAAQKHLEDVLLQLVEYYLRLTGEKYVCMAGGVFANVCVNQKILELPGVENIFVQPHMGDGGLALGAAVGVAYCENGIRPTFDSMYLGPEFTDSEIEVELKRYADVAYERIDNVTEDVIAALGENQVVGLCHGRMEFGPRALCNRSIIYHCSDTSVNKWLNERLNRTEFMPFAPVTAVELAEQCYPKWRQDQVSAKYMTLTYQCSPAMQANCPAVVHLDNTARPQIVEANDNPLMHSILTEWYRRTGGLSLLNTSFNAHEEPIVCSPRDAINSMLSGTVDTLYFGNFRITKAAITDI